MSHLKKLTRKGTLRQVFDAPSYMTPSPPLTHSIRVQIYAGKGGGEGWRDESERRLEGQQFTKLGQKYVPT